MGWVLQQRVSPELSVCDDNAMTYHGVSFQDGRYRELQAQKEVTEGLEQLLIWLAKNSTHALDHTQYQHLTLSEEIYRNYNWHI